MVVANLLPVAAKLAVFVAAFGALGAIIGAVFACRRGWLVLLSVGVSLGIYLLLCFREGILSARFSVWENVAEFFFDQFAFFLFFCLFPTLIVAALLGSWREKHWAKHANSI